MDIAGIKDADGDMFEIINQMINKKIYQMSKGVKFLLVFSKGQIENAKGKDVKELVDTLIRIFQGNISEIKESIKPIITKVNPNDDEFEIDTQRNYIYEALE